MNAETTAPAGASAAPTDAARELVAGLTPIGPTLYLARVRPEWLEESPQDPRGAIEGPDEPGFRALVLAMHAHGFLDPVEVVLVDAVAPRLRLIAGHRRVRAFRVARDEVAAGRASALAPTLLALLHMRVDDPLFPLLRALQENALRRRSRPHDLAVAARRLAAHGLGRRGIAAALGVSGDGLGDLLAIAGDPVRLAAGTAGGLALRGAARGSPAVPDVAAGEGTDADPPTRATPDRAAPRPARAAAGAARSRGAMPDAVPTRASAPLPDDDPPPAPPLPLVLAGADDPAIPPSLSRERATRVVPSPASAPDRTTAPASTLPDPGGRDAITAGWSAVVRALDERLGAAAAAAADGHPWPAVTFDDGRREAPVAALARLLDELDLIRAADPALLPAASRCTACEGAT